jgi:hypothetical protein
MGKQDLHSEVKRMTSASDIHLRYGDLMTFLHSITMYSKMGEQ